MQEKSFRGKTCLEGESQKYYANFTLRAYFMVLGIPEKEKSD